jgi:hypothetical protein
VIEACHFFLVPSWSSNTPLYPSIVLRARECAPTPCSSVVFSLGLIFESLKELGVRQVCFQLKIESIKIILDLHCLDHLIDLFKLFQMF